MRILSIDVGTKNCAFYIEDFSENEFSKIEKTKKVTTKKTTKKKKVVTEVTAEPLSTNDALYKIGTCVYWNVINFEDNGDIFVSIVKFLDSHHKIWDECNGIIIEKQLKINYSAQIIQHFLFSYFRITYGPFKYISDISATRKTQVLGAPKKLDKKDRKKWAVVEARKLLTLRGDKEGLRILDTPKADDLADSCLQLKAFQKLVFVDGILP